MCQTAKRPRLSLLCVRTGTLLVPWLLRTRSCRRGTLCTMSCGRCTTSCGRPRRTCRGHARCIPTSGTGRLLKLAKYWGVAGAAAEPCTTSPPATCTYSPSCSCACASHVCAWLWPLWARGGVHATRSRGCSRPGRMARRSRKGVRKKGADVEEEEEVEQGEEEGHRVGISVVVADWRARPRAAEPGRRSRERVHFQRSRVRRPGKPPPRLRTGQARRGREEWISCSARRANEQAV